MLDWLPSLLPAHPAILALSTRFSSYNTLRIWNRISKSGISFIHLPLTLAASPIFLQEDSEQFDVSCSSPSFPYKCRSGHQKHKESQYTLFFFCSLKLNNWQWFIVNVYGSTASPQLMEVSMRTTARNVALESLKNFDFELACSFLYASITSALFITFLFFIRKFLVAVNFHRYVKVFLWCAA